LREQLKRLGRDSVIYGVGHITTRLLTFLLLPYYSFHLTPAEYGEVTLYFLFIAVVQTFYFYGLDIAYLRYFGLTKEPAEQKRITGTAVTLSLLTSAAFTLVIWLLSVPIGHILIKSPVHPEITAPMIRICAGILFFDTLSTFPFILLRGLMRPVRFATVKLVNVAVNIGLNVWFVGTLDLSVSGILWANLIASAVSLLVLLPDLRRYFTPALDRSLISEMVVFGLPNVPTYLFVMLVELADRKFVEVYRGLDEAGLYSAGYKLGMFMAVVTGAFRFAWQPFFLSHAQEENAPRLFARVMTYYLLITATLFLALSFFVYPLVTHQWPGIGHLIAPSYWPGLAVFPIILLAHIFDGVYANLMVGIYLKKMTRRLPMVTGAAAVATVVLNFWLVPIYGMMAAAWITLFAFMLQAILLWFVVRRFYSVDYEWSRIGRLILVSGVVYAVATFAVPGSLWWRAGLLVLFPILLFAVSFFDEREKFHLRRLLPIR
jgi:O-antigen/teichoic acid export membrane protein